MAKLVRALQGRKELFKVTIRVVTSGKPYTMSLLFCVTS